ncbi:transcriptional regulator [Arenimonas soli]|uniref:Transcriptional regulator n=1 Tax=Arenimonas soli TaxID=2269504 RepID=A0ABQ1HFN0_9GAMM|nr:helicase RepA family protein [Arenimonas soli]GGA75560.1 transcriptional regulator [Arenimonas soli]
MNNLQQRAEMLLLRDEPRKPRALIRFTPAADLLSEPKPLAWLIRNIFEQDAVCLVNGAPGSFKSFFAFEIACCVSSGTPWHGNRVHSGPVFVIVGEGHYGVRRRLKAWANANQVDLAAAPLFVSERAVTLTDPDASGDLAEAIQGLREIAGADPVLIVVDTVARAFRGDENSSQDMGAFLQAVDEVRSHWRASVLLVHHVGHGANDRARGSSALRGAVDWEYLAERDGLHVTLRCTKAKDAPMPEPQHFKLQQVELPWRDEDGDFQTSAVLVPADAPEGGTEASGRGLGQRQQRALDALGKLYRTQGDTLERAGHPRERALVTVEDWKHACAEFIPDRRDFDRVKKSLIERKTIHVEMPHVRLV